MKDYSFEKKILRRKANNEQVWAFFETRMFFFFFDLFKNLWNMNKFLTNINSEVKFGTSLEKFMICIISTVIWSLIADFKFIIGVNIQSNLSKILVSVFVFRLM